jgi:hypothetical protein
MDQSECQLAGFLATRTEGDSLPIDLKNTLVEHKLNEMYPGKTYCCARSCFCAQLFGIELESATKFDPRLLAEELISLVDHHSVNVNLFYWEQFI